MALGEVERAGPPTNEGAELGALHPGAIVQRALHHVLLMVIARAFGAFVFV
tara:strand:- start:1415 stop:1567 length:153 start_codon:yes stop_codon:yes gene_type:complete